MQVGIMFNVRESLLFAWGIAAGALAIATYVAAGHPGFGAVALSIGLFLGAIVVALSDQIARSQDRTIGRILGVRITVLNFAVLSTFLLPLMAALERADA